MRWKRIAARLAVFTRRLLHALARPATSADDRHGIALQAYRGYGSGREVFLLGRVFRQPRAPAGGDGGQLSHDALNVMRRLFRRGAAGAELIARFDGTEQRLVTDGDGYLRVHMRLERPPPQGLLWHPLELELLTPVPMTASGQVFIPPDSCRFVVVSDIDDTVVHTGVANKLVMLWRFAMRGGGSPTAVPGIARLLRALHRGASGNAANPLLYVSRAPWAIYELLDEFFNANRIPVGPILFLREWGVSPRRPFPRRARAHKLTVIRNMLELYHDLPFVLIGDSGEGDPEIYTSLVREHGDRVLAIYIRDLDRDPARTRAITALAHEVAAVGSRLVLAADSAAMIAHAAAHGLIAPAASAGTEPDDLVTAPAAAPTASTTWTLAVPEGATVGERTRSQGPPR